MKRILTALLALACGAWATTETPAPKQDSTPAPDAMHAPAQRFDIAERGFLREGCAADLVLVDPDGGTPITRERIIAKCGWSPFLGERFHARVAATYVNGELAWDGNNLIGAPLGQRLRFAR